MLTRTDHHHHHHETGPRPPPALLPSYHPYIHLKYKAQRKAKGTRVLLQLASSNVRLAGGPVQHGYGVKISYECSGPSLYWQRANHVFLDRIQDQTYMLIPHRHFEKPVHLRAEDDHDTLFLVALQGRLGRTHAADGQTSRT